MVRKIVGMLGSVLANSAERGLVAQNVVRSLRGSRRREKTGTPTSARKEAQGWRRHPAPEEIKAIIANLSGRWGPSC